MNLRRIECITFCLVLVLITLLSYLLFIRTPPIKQIITLTISKENKVKAVIDNRPIITIILTDYGISRSLDSLSEKLPTEINFGISPYNLDNISNSNLKNNILFNIPLAQITTEDTPSPSPLKPNDEEDINLKKLNNLLQLAKNYQGVYTDENEIYSKNISEANFFLSKLQKENSIYLCGLQDKNANIYKIAKKIGFHILANDVILDEVLSTQAINVKLKELEDIAKKKGFAVAKGSHYLLTIDSLKSWLPSLKNKNIRLVSIVDFYRTTYTRNINNSEYSKELLDNLEGRNIK